MNILFKPPEEVNVLMNKQYNAVEKANTEIIDIWLEHIVFTLGWWISLSLTILPWIIWIKYRKKSSTNRLLLGGIWSICIATWLNYMGVTMGLWRYNVKTIPLIPDFIAWDFSLMPVSIMFFLQFKPKTKPLIKGIVFAGVTSFLVEPFFKWLGFFEYPNWHFVASFPFYVGIFLVANYLANGHGFEKIDFKN
jgi:hypothetical protein